MGRWIGSRALVGICGLLVLLLAALAAVQYRWSTRVAAADAQREKEHLDAAAALFASEFNDQLARVAEYAQSDALTALESGGKAAAPPQLIGELYYLEVPGQSAARAQRLTPEGAFAPAALPQWLDPPRCAAFTIEQPPALVSPLYDVITTKDARGGVRVLRTLGGRRRRCFVARLDERYLRETLFPRLVQRSFGATAAGEYDFAVVLRGRPQTAVYGAPLRADLRKPFFSLEGRRLLVGKPPGAPPTPEGPSALFVQHMESTIVSKGAPGLADLFGAGIWELEVAHKGVPLAAAFEQTRRRNLLLSLGVEALLMAAIVVLVIGARRAERLAQQKMQFVAGVSHELRSPVSAIAMLSRNQADGLVAGADRVKQYGELIHQQARRLNEMVEQTLQYAGVHSGLRRPARDRVDLRQLMEEALDARRDELLHGGFQVETVLDPDLPPVWGDAKLLRTAFDNLLNNALKYAAGGRWLRVSAGYSAPDKEVRIGVEDRGDGIDPEEQAGIFEPFCRGRAALEAQIPGSGLGLSLVRGAAEAHRGSVTLVSEPGRGSTFTLHLPV